MFMRDDVGCVAAASTAAAVVAAVAVAAGAVVTGAIGPGDGAGEPEPPSSHPMANDAANRPTAALITRRRLTITHSTALAPGRF
jgi:hypothetical protein